MLLSELEIRTKLKELDNWIRQDSKIVKEFKFQSFSEVVAFFNSLAFIANKLNHHPDFFNSYLYCKVVLSTNDYKGLTQIDFDFARELDEWTSTNAAF